MHSRELGNQVHKWLFQCNVRKDGDSAEMLEAVAIHFVGLTVTY